MTGHCRDCGGFAAHSVDCPRDSNGEPMPGAIVLVRAVAGKGIVRTPTLLQYVPRVGELVIVETGESLEVLSVEHVADTGEVWVSLDKEEDA